MIRPTYKIEKELFAEGFAVAGCDEVGRGCLAGPVVAAVVQLPEKLPPGWKTLLRDSKLLSRLQRVEADTWIRTHAVKFGIGLVDAATIDRINILQASYEAMRIALRDFDERIYVLVDGHLRIPGIAQRQTAIVGGDAISASIAAASIIAKEYRDRLMEDLHKEFPLYHFDKHKGYGTSLHMKAIAAHGLSSEHRISFCTKIPGAGAGTESGDEI